MQVFSELSHAFVVARFYEELKSAFGNRGTEAFAHMTTVYARQRGSRMAQRAIRDGKPLDFTSYRIYGEWQKTEAAERVTGGFAGRTVSIAPDHEEYIEACPWAWQFKEMGASECGVLYCTHWIAGSLRVSIRISCSKCRRASTTTTTVSRLCGAPTFRKSRHSKRTLRTSEALTTTPGTCTRHSGSSANRFSVRKDER